jgi:hypothetical protein
MPMTTNDNCQLEPLLHLSFVIFCTLSPHLIPWVIHAHAADVEKPLVVRIAITKNVNLCYKNPQRTDNLKMSKGRAAVRAIKAAWKELFCILAKKANHVAALTAAVRLRGNCEVY